MIRRFLDNLKDNFLAEQTRWIALIPILFGLGIGIYFAIDFEPKYWISLIILEVLLLIFYFVRNHRIFHLPLMGILLITLGFANAQLHTIYQSRRVENHDRINTYISGKIQDISLSTTGKKRLLLTSASDFDKDLKGEYRITMLNNREKFAIGDCVEMAASLLPAAKPSIKNSFQLDRKYFFDGLSSTGYTLGDVFKIDCPANLKKRNFSSFVNTFRHQIIERINSSLSSEEAGVADALLVGEKSYISKQIIDNYRNSGLAHFLAVSGLHLGTIAGLVFFLIRWLVSIFPCLALRYDSKKIAAIFAIVFAFMYLLVSGMAIPAQRAFIMTSTVLIGVIFDRQAISLRMVSFAAFMVLLLSPSALISVSFQMSFAAVTALVVFYEKYARKIATWSYDKGFIAKAFYYLLGVVVCDFIASLATSPFSVYHFQRIALYTCLGNLLAGPLIAFWLMPAILACLAVMPFNIMLYPLKVLAYGIGILNKITAFVASLPDSVLYVNSLDFNGFMLIVGGAIWLCLWQRKWRYFGIVAIVCGCMTMFTKPIPDVLIAFDGKGIALRDENSEMIIVPLGRADNWTKQLWQENFGLRDLNKAERQKLKNIFSGRKTDKKWIDIQCDKEKNCIYKNALSFTSDGKIFLNGKIIDKQKGAFVYFNETSSYFEYLEAGDTCRPWQKCGK